MSALRRLALSGVHWKHQFDSASAEVAQLKQQAAYREWKAKSRDKYHKIMVSLDDPQRGKSIYLPFSNMKLVFNTIRCLSALYLL